MSHATPLAAARAHPALALLPGLVLAATVAVLAFQLRRLPGVAAFSPMILAILLGIAWHNIAGTPRAARAGVAFSMRRILRFAIVLLGLQLTAAQVAAVGAGGIGVIAATLVATLAVSVGLGRWLRVDPQLALLIGAGTSICGASAVIAVNTVARAPDEDVAYAVACVTIFGSVAMFVYPLLPALLGLSAHDYGLWTGASIHEIAQVVAAGYQDGEAAGRFATIAKLSRVMMLAPVVLALGFGARRAAGGAAKAPMPWFVLGFIAMVAVNSVIAVPPDLQAAIVGATTFLLTMALAAMGLETDIRKLRAKGLRPLALGLLAFLFIAGFSLMLVRLVA